MSRKLHQRTFAEFESDLELGDEVRDESASTVEEISVVDNVALDLSGQSVYLVDAHSLIFQVFHALPEMTGAHGQPVGAVFGFTRDILYLFEEKQPDFLFCAFDRPGKTFRHDLYDQYKLHREEMPDDLRPQIVSIRRMLEALAVPAIDFEAHEADDVIATMARHVESLGGMCYLVTGDKDCRQLLSDHIKIYDIRKDKLFDTDALQNTWGIRPDQVVDFQTLVGDAIDNVPGIPLIGPKTASELLQKFDTLEGVFDNPESISGKKRRQNLLDGQQQAILSRQLVRLADDLPLEIDWQAGRVGGYDAGRARELFREFGFRGLTEKLDEICGIAKDSAWNSQYHLVDSEESLSALMSELPGQTRIAIHIDASGHPRSGKLRGIGFCWQDEMAHYVPLAEHGIDEDSSEQALGQSQVLEQLRPYLEDQAIGKIGHDLKRAMILLHACGVKLRGCQFDPMLASYLVDAGGRAHSLEELSKRYLQHEPLVEETPSTLASRTQYGGDRAEIAWRLAPLLDRGLTEENLQPLFRDLELPLIEVLAELEFNGIRVDVHRLDQLGRDFQSKMDQLEEDIYELAGHPFNIGSPKQLATVLFDELALPVIKKTKTGTSTDAEVLDELAKEHPLPAKIIEYRQFAKLKGTYIDSLPQLVHPETRRVHTTFNQVVAATGRLSSNDPNLQNIPVRTVEGRDIRSAFLADTPGWQLLCADYSQIELRILAHFSGDRALSEAFAAGEDIHARVASEVYEVDLENVTREMRRAAKAINFGVIYGQSPFGLASALSISREEAASFIDAYFDGYPGVDEFIHKVLADCRQNGYVSTTLGRRRRIQGVRNPSKLGKSRQRTLPERTAINTVIQGSAADLIKQAMLRVFRRLQREGFEARMLLQIHDELVFEVPASHVSSLAEIVTDEMTHVGDLSVPLKVDVKTGSNWAQCEGL